MRAALVGLVLLAAGTDLSWLVDSEINEHVAFAKQQAVAYESTAKQSDAIKAQVVTRRTANVTEKASLEGKLETLKRGERTKAEARIAELAGKITSDDARMQQLANEAAAHRKNAAAQRTFAAAAEAEGKARAADTAKWAIDPDADFGPLADARLLEGKKYYLRRQARVPKQLEALEAELNRPDTMSISDRGSVVARKEAVRSLSADDLAMIQRIDDELRFRADSKSDEAEAARLVETAAAAKAAEDAPEVTVTKTPDKVDAMLDRVIAEQDRVAAEKVETAQTIRWVIRIGVTMLGFGGLVAVVFFLMRRMK